MSDAAVGLVRRLHDEGLTFTQIVKTVGRTRSEIMVLLQIAGISKKQVNRGPTRKIRRSRGPFAVVSGEREV